VQAHLEPHIHTRGIAPAELAARTIRRDCHLHAEGLAKWLLREHLAVQVGDGRLIPTERCRQLVGGLE
jgi:hypothetical protein